MPATLILTTLDPALETAWKNQLLPRAPAVFARPADLQRELLRPGSRVWISDINDPRARLASGNGTLVILVGEPQSLPFEQARQNRTARLYLGFAESRTRLAEAVNLLEEIADKNSQLQSALERTRRSEPPFPREAAAAAPAAEPVESWDFLESALAHLGDRPRLLDEFRRAGRYILKSGKVLFFFRQQDAFVSDDEAHRCSAGHPLSLWLEEHPAILDSAQWPGTEDPALDAPIRQQLQGWGARLLVPLHGHGQLLGWMALGPRADGAPFRESDKFRAVLQGRLLERCLEHSAELAGLRRTETDSALLAKYLPGARLVTRTELASAELPVEVRAIIGEVLHTDRTITPAPPARPGATASRPDPRRRSTAPGCSGRNPPTRSSASAASSSSTAASSSATSASPSATSCPTRSSPSSPTPSFSPATAIRPCPPAPPRSPARFPSPPRSASCSSWPSTPPCWARSLRPSPPPWTSTRS
jgi:hypothetical protein